MGDKRDEAELGGIDEKSGGELEKGVIGNEPSHEAAVPGEVPKVSSRTRNLTATQFLRIICG